MGPDVGFSEGNIVVEALRAVRDVLARRHALRRSREAGTQYWQKRARLSRGHSSLDSVAASAYLLTLQPEMREHLDRLLGSVPSHARAALKERVREM